MSTARQAWMAVLAKTTLPLLEDSVATCEELPSYTLLRSPEVVLAMVRGRAGGDGEPFNLGEITLTRCVVQMDHDGETITGFGYVAGRSARHAELAAQCDALLQHHHWRDKIQEQVIAPLQKAYGDRREQETRQAAATRVEFFTLLRGES